MTITLKKITLPAFERNSWPRITIITPSYNQGHFLEETIRSVLLQDYPNLEYLVIDGGSTDNSVDIIRKYENKMDYWVSEPDNGQAHAINKGFTIATGDLIGWLNSDDRLLPGVLFEFANAYQHNPESIILGDVIHFRDGSDKRTLIRQKNVTVATIPVIQYASGVWQQPGTYVPRSLIMPNCLLDEKLRYTFDIDWMCRLLQKAGVYYLHKPVAEFRLHPNSKTVGEKYAWLPEIETVAYRYWDQIVINKPYLKAQFELFRAAVALGVVHWDRDSGRNHLYQALKTYPNSIFLSRFWELILRSLLPASFVRFMKMLRKK